jgi:predicted ATP-dependent endonuclease of OLD family
MIKLTQAHVWKFKSIEDSTPVKITDAVTVLVGKNESGKTSFLHALNKSMPLQKAAFDVVQDYPRNGYIRYKARHADEDYERVVELTLAPDDTLINKINAEVFYNAKVVKHGLTFTRNTDYNNGHTVGFNIDESEALEAFKNGLKGVEQAEEVFKDTKTLAQLVASIEAKNLPADSKLAVLGKRWKTATAEKTAGWNPISWYVWHNYLSPNLPKFLYFDDYSVLSGKINLPSLQARKANSQLTESDETVLGLLDLAGVTLDEMTSDEGYETSKAKLEAIGLDITRKVFKFWKQNQDLDVEFDIKTDSKDIAPFNSGPNLYIRIKNRRHGVTVPFDQRSKGFIWFFSFLVWFDSVQNRAGTKKELVLLLDEPGLNLHALAQADLLEYIRELAESHQVIYSTHSPFMIDSERLDEVRVVEDKIKEGTKVSGDLAGSSDESLFPLQAALGYTIAQNLFLAKKNILVEGPADLIVLQHLESLLEQAGKDGSLEGVIVPAGGLDKVATFISLLGANKLKVVVLHDKASKPNQRLEDLVQEKLIERKKVLDFTMFMPSGTKEADLEDILPAEAYVKAFNKTYKKDLGSKSLTLKMLGQHPRMVERINEWLKKEGILLLKDGGYNHYRVAQTFISELTLDNLSDDEIARYEAMFVQLNAALN